MLGVLGLRTVARRSSVWRTTSAFAREVAFWEERLGDLADAMAPVAPPERGLEPHRARHRRAAPIPRRRRGLWQSLIFWRSFAIGSAALAAASIGALTFIEISPAPRAPMLATLAPATGSRLSSPPSMPAAPIS